ncbi:non-ribosomal peptide synthetase [Streptomyces violaceorubidus]|uniref:AMP-binding protein n=1 Tax=Streptomyces violaceorubidus TaxID=284042 RepID=A0ABV1T2X7_9ACTN
MPTTAPSADHTWQRPVSPIEWIYQANPAETSMTPQIFVEGTGTIGEDELAAAVRAAAAVCPGARLVRRGRVWIDGGHPPEVRVLDGALLERVGHTHPGLDRPLRGDAGTPLTEVVLLTGEPTVVVFRAHHSVMDGRGLQLWISEVFRALRGEPLLGARSPLTETRLIRQVGVPEGVKPRLLKGDAAFRTRGAFHRRGGVTRRRTVPGVHAAVAAKTAATANRVLGLASGTAFFPVDLRRHLPDVRCTGNLTVGMGVHMDPESTWQHIYAQVLAGLSDKADLACFPNLTAIESVVRVPQRVMRPVLRLVDTLLSYTPGNTWSLSLTHLGRLSPADYTAPSFRASTVYAVPRRGYFFPPSFSLVEFGDHTEITLTADGGAAVAERMETLLDAVARDLAGDRAPQAQAPAPEPVTLRHEPPLHPAAHNAEPSTATPLRLIRQQAGRDPRAIALIEPGGRSLDYGRLADLVAASVDALHRIGVGGHDRVATVLSDGLDTSVLFLATASAAVCAPLSPAYSQREYDDALKAIAPALMVVAPGLSLRAREAAGRLGVPVAEFARTDDGHELTLTSGTLPGRSATAGSADSADPVAERLLLQTSGTTGQGKLVPLTWTTMLAGAQASAAAYELTPADRRLNIMPLFHVQGLVGSLLTALSSGSSVVCADAPEPDDVPAWLAEHGITWFSASPTMHQRILERAPANWRPPKTLRFVRSGSAALPPALRPELERFYGVPVVESYGMTEAHQVASTPVRAGAAAMRPTGSRIGFLSGGVVRTGTGIRGEIVVSGANVISRYAAPEEATADAFVEGWFRTGDEGELTADGELRITGRIKELIVRGGEKVAPAEVENVLSRHPAVRQVAVCGVPDPEVEEQVAAVVVLKPGAAATPDGLRAYARDFLAPYKLPTLFDFRDELAVGSGGKVSRASLSRELRTKALAALGDTARPPLEPTDVPRTALETRLAEIWSEVLGRQRVGVNDDFFTLGGQSLEGIALVNAVNKRLPGAAVEPLTLFDRGNTVARMARLIQDRAADVPQAGA